MDGGGRGRAVRAVLLGRHGGAAFGAMYDALFGRWAMVGPPRQVRVGIAVRF